MARMFPERPRDGTPESERRVFEELRSQLDDAWTVFHHVAWHGRVGPGGTVRDGEADFLLVHPGRALLVLDVKGGVVERCAGSGEWRQNGKVVPDPVDQAVKNKKALLAKIKERPEWASRRICLGHALAFPDARVPGEGLGPATPRHILLDHDDLRYLPAWLDRALADVLRDGDEPPGDEGVRFLVGLLGRSFRLQPVVVHSGRAARILELTEEQFQVLDLLDARPRAAIRGCAGSGKTLLAVEKVRRLCRDGRRTLFVCFNRLLARYISHTLEGVSGAEALHFHELCRGWAERAGLPFRGPMEDASIPAEEFYDVTLPNLLLEAVGRREERYDAIVADEGQDFLPGWWQPLLLTLRDPDRSDFYVFLDEGQNIFRRPAEIPVPGEPFLLTRNLRNTRQIHEFAFRFYEGPGAPVSRGPEGRPPELRYCRTPEEGVDEVRKVLHHLVAHEKVAPEDVVLLSPRSEANSAVWRERRFGNLELTGGEPGPGQVAFRTFQRFKGLESPVVVLAEVEPGFPDPRQVLYVGGTRATQHLVVVAREELRAMFESSRGGGE